MSHKIISTTTESEHNTISTTKLFLPISFISILSLGSATNHCRGRLHLFKAELEKIQKTMLEHDDETDDYECYCTEGENNLETNFGIIFPKNLNLH